MPGNSSVFGTIVLTPLMTRPFPRSAGSVLKGRTHTRLTGTTFPGSRSGCPSISPPLRAHDTSRSSSMRPTGTRWALPSAHDSPMTPMTHMAHPCPPSQQWTMEAYTCVAKGHQQCPVPPSTNPVPSSVPNLIGPKPPTGNGPNWYQTGGKLVPNWYRNLAISCCSPSLPVRGRGLDAVFYAISTSPPLCDTGAGSLARRCGRPAATSCTRSAHTLPAATPRSGLTVRISPTVCGRFSL